MLRNTRDKGTEESQLVRALIIFTHFNYRRNYYGFVKECSVLVYDLGL